MTMSITDLTRIGELLGSAKQIAKEYRRITGKPLGITGEVGEYEAARILGIELAEARQDGFDATHCTGGKTTRIQIKTRCLPANAKPGQRMSSWAGYDKVGVYTHSTRLPK